MNKLFSQRITCFLTSCLVLMVASCSNDNDLENPTKPTMTPEQKVNTFICEHTQIYYLWSGTINWAQIDPLKAGESQAFFNSLKYKDDSWSMVTNQYKELSEGFQGVSTTYGYRLGFGPLNETNYYGLVLYTYPGTPAERAGIKRGDLIVTNQMAFITKDNYKQLFDSPNVLLGMASVINDTLKLDTTLVYMNAESMYEDPVVKDTVLNKGAHKIGYLFYADYTNESHQKLLQVFSQFQAQGVTDVVLDLRYNGGGYVNTAALLSSILAPRSAAQAKKVFLKEYWNEAMMKMFKEEGYDIDTYLTDSLPVNMNLNRLYVLTTTSSASASEATIIGLKPYMEVIQIGDTTHGKYYGGPLLPATLWDEQTEDFVADPDINNWGIYLMAFRYDNTQGITAAQGAQGLAPNYWLDEMAEPIYALGDERDPLLKKAIELITGVPATPRAAGARAPYLAAPTMIQPRKLDGKLIQTRLCTPQRQ